MKRDHHKSDKKNKKRGSSKKILITAGPTREPLDPVRYITNHSSGTLGYKIAEKTRKEGYDVTLISGPVNIPPPKGVKVIPVETAREMEKEVKRHIKKNDCIVMAAAVCDFRAAKETKKKIKKKRSLNIRLTMTTDILGGMKHIKGIKRIGFALETNDPIKNGMKKLKEKGLDLIIINAKTRENDPFGGGAKKRDYAILDPMGSVRNIKKRTKTEIAEIIKKEIKKLV
ncbi:MAG: phosphopantothenoylcysteine decarboxylase [Candidatus Omnitrophota bacterium]